MKMSLNVAAYNTNLRSFTIGNNTVVCGLGRRQQKKDEEKNFSDRTRNSSTPKFSANQNIAKATLSSNKLTRNSNNGRKHGMRKLLESAKQAVEDGLAARRKCTSSLLSRTRGLPPIGNTDDSMVTVTRIKHMDRLHFNAMARSIQRELDAELIPVDAITKEKTSENKNHFRVIIKSLPKAMEKKLATTGKVMKSDLAKSEPAVAGPDLCPDSIEAILDEQEEALVDYGVTVPESDDITDSCMAHASDITTDKWLNFIKKDQTCMICLEALSLKHGPLVVLPCKHLFHQVCLHNMVVKGGETSGPGSDPIISPQSSTLCPLCRSPTKMNFYNQCAPAPVSHQETMERSLLPPRPLSQRRVRRW